MGQTFLHHFFSHLDIVTTISPHVGPSIALVGGVVGGAVFVTVLVLLLLVQCFYLVVTRKEPSNRLNGEQNWSCISQSSKTIQPLSLNVNCALSNNRRCTEFIVVASMNRVMQEKRGMQKNTLILANLLFLRRTKSHILQGFSRFCRTSPVFSKHNHWPYTSNLCLHTHFMSK